MSTRDRFDDIALRLMRSRLCDRDGCEDNVYCSECRHLAGHVVTVICDAVATETERCAKIADAESISRAAYAGELDRSDEIHMGANQHVASLALSQIAAAIRAKPPYDAVKAQVKQYTAQELCDMEGDASPFAASPRHVVQQPARSTQVGGDMDAVEWTKNEHGRHHASIMDVRLEIYSTRVDGVRRWNWAADIDAASCDGRVLVGSLDEAKSAAITFARRITK